MKLLIFLLLFACCVNLFSQNSNENILKEIIISEINIHKKFDNKVQLMNDFDENYTDLITLTDVFINPTTELKGDSDSTFHSISYHYDKYRKDFVSYLNDTCFKKLLNEKKDIRLFIKISTEDNLFYDIKIYGYENF